MVGNSIVRKCLTVGIILLFVGTYIIPTNAKNIEKSSSPVSKGNPEITRFDTVLEIENVRGGIGKITAKIKNIGEQPANNVSWSISLPTVIPGRWYFEGVIPTINPQNTSFIESSDFLIGFGLYDLTISAECESSHRIETEYTVFLFLLFVYIFR